MSTTNSPIASAGLQGYDVETIRREFPALDQEINGHPLAYLDNAATTQKPLAVLEALDHFYRVDCANIHRGVHQLSQRATHSYENARATMRRFVNARSEREIVFLRGSTEGLNLVAHSWGRERLTAQDEVLVTHLEHHSNIVPWQQACQATGARLRVVPIDERGEIDLEAFESLVSDRTKIVAVGHVSNALGTILPLERLVAAAHGVGAVIVVDGAQAAPHLKVDVRALDVDFYTLSGHKMYGPTGAGILYGKEEHLEVMPPFLGGGDMIRTVTFEQTTYNDLPHKFEAGTPDIAGMIGLGAAAEYLERLGLDAVGAHETRLLEHATSSLTAIEGVRILGTAREKAAVVSFVLEGVHPHDLGTLLDQEGIAVRTGHHCAQPVMDHYGVSATTRASFGLYNTFEEIDRLVRGVVSAKEMFGA